MCSPTIGLVLLFGLAAAAEGVLVDLRCDVRYAVADKDAGGGHAGRHLAGVALQSNILLVLMTAHDKGIARADPCA